MADIFLPQDVNKVMRDKIIACGAVPVIDDLFRTDAFNLLFAQLLSVIACAGGGGGVLYGIAQVVPGGTVEVANFNFGPVNSGNGFGVLAFNSMNPVRVNTAIGIYNLNTPLLGAIFSATIPALATWITSINLLGAGPSYTIEVVTNIGSPAGNTIVPFTFAGQNGILEIQPQGN